MITKLGKFLVLALVLSGVVWGVNYWINLETPRKMTPLMHDLAHNISQEFGKKLPRDQRINTLLVLITGRGHRDEERHFKEMLVNSIIATDKYRVRTWKDVQDQLDQNNSFLSQFLTKTNLVPGQEPTTVKDAALALTYLEKANFRPIDGIMHINVTNFTEGPNNDGLYSKIALTSKITRHHGKNIELIHELEPLSHSIDSPWDSRYVSYTISRQPILARFLLWLIIVCIIPWIGINLVRFIMRRRNNNLTFALLGVLTSFGVVLAWALLLAFSLTPLSLISLLIFSGLVGYYNHDAIDYINRRLL